MAMLGNQPGSHLMGLIGWYPETRLNPDDFGDDEQEDEEEACISIVMPLMQMRCVIDSCGG